VHNILVILPAI